MAKPKGEEESKRPWVIILPIVVTAAVALIGYYFQYVYRSEPPVEKEYHGRVRDAKTGKPIYKAKVSIEADQKGPQVQETDSEGVFKWRPGASTKDVRLIIEADGYKMFDRWVSPERTGSEPIQLEPLESPPPPLPQPSGPNVRNTNSGRGTNSSGGPAGNSTTNLRTRRQQAINALNSAGNSPSR